MNERLESFLAQLRALPPARRATLAVAAVGSLAFFGWLVFGTTAPEYRALYRGLPEDETARVADALLAEKIEHRIADGGTAVLVKAQEVAEARIRMAGRGLPSGGGAGFELFDRPAFGVTDFVHRVNYLRAVQGELARSIEQLEPVERARVQVVIPERGNVLAIRERVPSASAVLRLKPGRELDPAQVRAVVHLIASGIESLEPKKVTVVDGMGRLLAPLEDAGPGSLATSGVTGYQQRVEKELSERIESILEKTVGPGAVVARVRADVDWTETETTEEVYDPDSQVARSERRSTEHTTPEDLADEGGAPGIATNVPDEAIGSASASASGSSRETETINYEISKSVSRRTVPMGRLQRLSIAVLVADPAPETEGEDPVPWSPEDLGRFEALARQAVGFDEKRGDQITVQSAPFRSPSPVLESEPSFWPQWSPLLVAIARGLFALLALVLFARFIVRPLTASLPGSAAGPQLPARLGDLEPELAVEGGLDVSATIPSNTGPQAEDGARALRNWLNQG